MKMKKLLSTFVILVLFFPSKVFSRVYTGTVSSPFQYMGSFSFGVDPNPSNPVGTATLTFTYADGSTVPASAFYFDDTVYSNIVSGGCNAVLNNGFTSGFTSIPLPLPAPPAPNVPVVEQFAETIRPHVWYFTLASDCVNNPQITSYTLDLRQADGTLLGYDELGMPSIYAAFWILNLLILLPHALRHYFPVYFPAILGKLKNQKPFAPAMVRWLTLSLVLFSLSSMFHMIDWAQVASTGVGNTGCRLIADFLRIASLMALWVLCALAATGYGIITYNMSEKNYNWLGWILLATILILYLALAILIALPSQLTLTATGGLASIWPGLTLLVVTILYAAWWFWKIRSVTTAEVNTTKKQLLWDLTKYLSLNFFVLPFAFFISAVTPAWERTRIATGFDLFVITCINIALCYVLWPSNAQDAFRVYDGSTSIAMLSLGMAGDGEIGAIGVGGGPGDFHSALDQAYSYSDMGVAMSDRVGGSGSGAGAGGGVGGYVAPKTGAAWQGSL